ncbi:MAG TPA: sulfite exporter TauE/SafE family protein [Cytophagaceae bacterium]
MDLIISFFALFLGGLVGGFIAGLVGIGGGVVYVFIIPIALKYIGVPLAEIPQYTIANSIFAILFASSSANYMLIKHKNFYWKEVLLIGVLAIVSSHLTLEFIVNTPWYSLEAFNIVIVILLSYMFYSTLLTARKVYLPGEDELKKTALGLTGVAGGSIASLSGLGGGIVIIPILNSYLKVDIKKASSISSGVIMLSALTITVSNLVATPMHPFSFYNSGYVIFPISIALSCGVVVASPLGVNVARKLSSKTISYIYAFFLLIVIVKKVIELITINS